MAYQRYSRFERDLPAPGVFAASHMPPDAAKDCPPRPWRCDGALRILDAKGATIAIVHGAQIGRLKSYARIGRMLASAGDLFDALARLRTSEDEYIAAKQRGDDEEKLRPLGNEWARAREAADDAMKFINDPVFAAAPPIVATPEENAA